MTLWLLGYPDQARERSREALAVSHERFDSSNLAFAYVATALVHQGCREAQSTQELTEALVTLATEQGLAFWVPYGTVLQGWALAMLGQREEGITQMSQGMATWYAMGTIIRRTYFLALLGETYGSYGQVEDGLHVMAEALALVEKTGERFYEAEIHRLKGQLLQQQSSDNAAEAEICFHQALSIARQQQAKSWELRAATSFAKLWQSQNKRDEARQLLGEVYEWFTEGHDTADLKDAKALLDELS
jgi:adenylate cyclase